MNYFSLLFLFSIILIITSEDTSQLHRCIKSGLVGTQTSNLTYQFHSATNLFTNASELQSTFKKSKGSHFIFMGDSNVRFIVITLLHLIDPIEMKKGWKSRWNSSENGFPHIKFIDVALKNGQIVYSSTTKKFQGELNREIFRVTFLWSPQSKHVIPVIKKFYEYVDYSDMQIFLYVCLGLWDVGVPGKKANSKIEIDNVMESYCNYTISHLLSDFCHENKILCVVGTMPDFGKPNGTILDYATRSQVNFCSIHACNLLNKSVVLYDQGNISKSLKSEESGQHFSHIYGVISYLSIFQIFQEMFIGRSKALADITYTIKLFYFRSVLFDDSCRRFSLNGTKRPDWVGQFCQYDLLV